ncbi:hypothetical protein GLA29479_2400 [Lysobacter antibioticus]|uniref:hypothetical protein n=1 Tax=Lysobacter antibioticus TaxID=84531 RepID=UPI000716EB76|nr:hypothetical protein [Lysobacter antibioticus]ALN63269.1 hypothetical protein GLA29479_2400 [Lysobacter antibioticus]
MRTAVLRHALTFAVLALALSSIAAPSFAQGFSALVSPPRFEDTVKPGTTYRNVVEISNISNAVGRYTLKTADWHLDAQGAAVFDDALAADSCRPWVGLEAAQIEIAPNGKRRYRFEVVVPEQAAPTECRFAILLEGAPEMVGDQLTVPVSGRIGIIVYLGIGDVAAQLQHVASQVREVDGRRLPVLDIRNTGKAHTRLEGLVNGVDASGRKFALAPSSLPILPGETRSIALVPEGDDPATPAPPIVYPLSLKGALEWGRQRLELDVRIDK